MKLSKPAAPFVDDVRVTRNSIGEVECNVPHSVVMHSPAGYEVGYAGSGPADLALNILNAFMPPGRRGGRAEKCFKGDASEFAIRHHQQFKAKYIQGMPREGGVIRRADVLAWIKERETRNGDA